MKARTLSFFLLSAVLTVPISTMATDLVSFRFTGHVTEIIDDDCSTPLLEPGAIAVDDPVSGVFTYDLDATDYDPDLSVGVYHDHSPPSPHNATINTVTFQNDPNDPSITVLVGNDLPSFPQFQDAFEVDNLYLSFVHSDLGLDDPEITISLVVSVTMFSDYTMTVLSDDSLPSSLNLDDWDETRYTIFIYGDHSSDPSCDASAGGFAIVINNAVDTLNLCLGNETGLCSNGIDDDCDGLTDNDDSADCGGYSATANAEASTFGSTSLTGSGAFNGLALILVPIGAVMFLRIWRRKR